MESKIRKKTISYGVAAIAIVAIATTLAYNTGLYNPQPNPPTPQTPPGTPALFTTFTSGEALRNFLGLNSKNQGPFQFYGPADVRQLNTLVEGFDAKASSPGLMIEYSPTNIQVAGVDEADIVKTDGEYLYVLSGNSLYILKAYPASASKQVAKIAFEDLYPVGIFVNGDRLIVLGSRYFIPTRSTYGYFAVDVKTFVRVYDIHDRAHPVVLRDLMLTGSYFNSRMIGEYIYFVVSQPAYVIYDTLILPKIYYNGELVKEIAPSEIHYSNGSDNYYQYTTFVALNALNLSEPPTYVTMMLGGTSSMYVSTDNMYVTFPSFDGNTTIYRIHVQNNNLTAEAKGEVLGHELNQFSMDEYNGYFRIATARWVDGVPRSNVIALDMNLSIVGKLLDIEVGETLDSARFMEKRCYISTSVVRRDPFFVIDVENAMQPKILGYLKIPGFNRYLHSYDENHVIGVGRDEFGKVKVSLFDVTNVSAPINVSEYRFGGEWSDTTVLTDHKAFLFAFNKNLLAMPVSVSYYGPEYSNHQGLFVFNVTLSAGFVLKGNVTHQGIDATSWDYSYYVKRGSYIEDILYTISDKKIKLSNLVTLELLKEIPFS